MKSKIESTYVTHDKKRICQGDILRDFVYLEPYETDGNEGAFLERTIPYLIVLTQDCDLESDYWNYQKVFDKGCESQLNQVNAQKSSDKLLQSILVCPAYPSEQVRKGVHLDDLGIKMQEFNSVTMWNFVTTNQNPRYHFLNGNLEMQIPDLIVDFKHYYAIPMNVLYNKFEKKYWGTVNELFRESLSQRFAYYLSRIGLPELE